jgi:tripartite motif-containing protein 6/22/34
LNLLDLVCFFQEMFQESLKKLRRDQQEAERLKGVIREKRTSWKARMIPPKGVLG